MKYSYEIKEFYKKNARFLLPALLFLIVLIFKGPYADSFFNPEEYGLFGPVNAERFLKDPLNPFKRFQGFGHYAPLTMTLYALETIFFGKNIFLYNLLNLILFEMLVLALYYFLTRAGIGLFASFISSLWFGVGYTTVQMVSVPSYVNYTILGLLLLGTIHYWLKFKENQERKIFILCLFLNILAMLTHSLAVIIPVLIVASDTKRTGHSVVSRQKKYGALAIITLTTLLIYFVPRQLLNANGAKGQLELKFSGMFEAILRSLKSIFLAYSNYKNYKILFFCGVLIIFILLLMVFFLRMREQKVLLLGATLIVVSIFVTYSATSYDAAFYATRFRYLFFPTMGLSIVISELIQQAYSRKKSLTIALVVTFSTVSLLVSNYYCFEYAGYMAHGQGYVKEVLKGYRKNIDALVSREYCSEIGIVDSYLFGLDDNIPGTNIVKSGHLSIQYLNYKSLHDYYFYKDHKYEKIKFIEISNLRQDNSDCIYFMLGTRMFKFSEGYRMLPIFVIQ